MQAVSGLPGDLPGQRAPRPAHAERARHRGFRGSSREGRTVPRHRRRGPDRSSRGARPSRSTSWPRAGGSTYLKSGDEIVLSELEHHSNLVPWQMIARERGAGPQVRRADRRLRLTRRRGRRGDERSDAPGRRDRDVQRHRHRASRWPGSSSWPGRAGPGCSSTRPRACPHHRFDVDAAGGRFRGLLRPQDVRTRRASASSMRSGSCSRRCRRSWPAAAWSSE